MIMQSEVRTVASLIKGVGGFLYVRDKRLLIDFVAADARAGQAGASRLQAS